MDSRLNIICRGECRRRLEVIAGRRGQTLTALAGYMLAERVDQEWTKMIQQQGHSETQSYDGRAGHFRKEN